MGEKRGTHIARNNISKKANSGSNQVFFISSNQEQDFFNHITAKKVVPTRIMKTNNLKIIRVVQQNIMNNER